MLKSAEYFGWDLTIGLSTTCERLSNIDLAKLVPHPNIAYILSVQAEHESELEKAHEALATISDRADCQVKYSRGHGVAKSRNIVIDNCETDLLWFCDDDLEYEVYELSNFAAEFIKMKNISFACGISFDEKGNIRKKFPQNGTRLNRLNSAKFATYEIMVKPRELRQMNVRFDENFGAGKDNDIGDEFIFVSDVIRSKGKGVFISLPLCEHIGLSSGLRYEKLSDICLRSKPIFHRVFPYSWPFFWTGFIAKKIVGSMLGTR